jgi:hypothetical protein
VTIPPGYPVFDPIFDRTASTPPPSSRLKKGETELANSVYSGVVASFGSNKSSISGR